MAEAFCHAMSRVDLHVHPLGAVRHENGTELAAIIRRLATRPHAMQADAEFRQPLENVRMPPRRKTPEEMATLLRAEDARPATKPSSSAPMPAHAPRGQRLHAAPPSTQKVAQCGWFSATGRAASASVAPSSKRGS